ncbi:signal peptidase I [Pontibacillus salicampi]|uniref:Signal peptidase I n=1 Tax=Pontibacillus salicampi TaxID=1449801 RepID=A0ABV6LIN9_9BACI
MSQHVRKEAWEWLKAIAIAFILAFVIRNFVFATSIVEGTSMDPTLEDGERVMYNKMIYMVGEPERGDIVIIQRPSKNYVKRVVGLPGDTIQVKEHQLYVNGQRVKEDYLNQHAIQQTSDFPPRSIPEGHYFVMGDNRDISKDSRNGLGLVKREEMIGRSELVIYPFEDWHMTR